MNSVSKAAFSTALAFLLCCDSSFILAQTPSASPAAASHSAKIQDIKKLLAIDIDATQTEKMLDREEELAKRKIPASKTAEANKARSEIAIGALETKLQAAAIPLLDAKFSDDEIKALAAFRSSPAGKKLLNVSDDNPKAKPSNGQLSDDSKNSDKLLARLADLDLPEAERQKAREFLSSPLGLKAANEVEPELSAKLKKICEQTFQETFARVAAAAAANKAKQRSK